MKKKVTVLFFLLFSFILFLPSYAGASVTGSSGLASTARKPQVAVEFRFRHDRGLHRGWYRHRHASWYYYQPEDPMYARQVYWVNGRQYVRWVRYN